MSESPDKEPNRIKTNSEMSWTPTGDRKTFQKVCKLQVWNVNRFPTNKADPSAGIIRSYLAVNMYQVHQLFGLVAIPGHLTLFVSQWELRKEDKQT